MHIPWSIGKDADEQNKNTIIVAINEKDFLFGINKQHIHDIA
jgi:hypothetical protein